MNEYILSYPKHLSNLFDDEQTIFVQSQFLNSLNLLFKGTLITLQHREALKTPMSIVLDLSPKAFQLLIGNDIRSVHITNEGIKIQGILFYSKRAKIIDHDLGHLKKYDEKEIALLHSTLKRFLLESNRKGDLVKAFIALDGSLQTGPSEFGIYAKKVMGTLLTAKSNDYIENCMKLYGAGEGLTPSGDDFLCGLLAATYFSKYDPVIEIREKLIRNLSVTQFSTTEVSRAYLENACCGRFSELIIMLHGSAPLENDRLDILHQISCMGHSSGTDFLVGMFFGFQVGGTN
jgi:hypothetical protein